ncbi:MAG: DMT family transporter [Microgenomates group bacterium]
MLSWHYFALATVLTGSISNIILRVLMKKEESDPILFTIVFQFILTGVVLLYALFKGFVFPPPSFLWPRLMLSALLYAAGSLCSFYASKHLPAGENAIVTAGGSIITIILGILFLGDSFGMMKVIGVGSIVASIVVLYARVRMKMNTGLWYAMGVMVFYAVAVVNDIIIIKSYNAISFVPLMCFLPGVILALIFPKKTIKMYKLLNPTSLSHIGIYSVFYGASAITYYQALGAGATVSQLSPISRASIIATVLLAALFLGERKQVKRKMVSAALVSIGVFLLG